MTKIKLAIDIFLTAAWIVVVALGTVLRDWALVGISSAAALVFANLVWYDLIKIDAQLPKYVIRIGRNIYYDGRLGATCEVKAKRYRSKRVAKRVAEKLLMCSYFGNPSFTLDDMKVEEAQNDRI